MIKIMRNVYGVPIILTLLKVIKTILGEENVSTISIERFTDERYTNSLKGKLANLCNDLKDKLISEEKMDKLKNFSAYDTVENRKLYGDEKSETFTASQIFTTTHSLC
jgi:putative DNA primase/helicase